MHCCSTMGAPIAVSGRRWGQASSRGLCELAFAALLRLSPRFAADDGHKKPAGHSGSPITPPVIHISIINNAF